MTAVSEGIGWVLLALALLALLRGLYEPRHLAVTHRTLAALRPANRRCSSPPPAGQDASDGRPACQRLRLRIGLISDLHAERLWIKPGQIAAELLKTPVDLFFFTGDLAGDDKHADKAAPFLTQLGTAMGAAGTPFLAVPGNHDGFRAISLMRKAGIDVLQDEQRRLMLADGTTVLVTGLADRRPDARSGSLLQAESAADHAVRIVLVHNPDAVLDLPEGGADFLFGGHFHGGQIYAPFQLEFRLLRHDRLPLIGHWRGPFQLRGYQGYISRGLGCVWLPLRVLSRPELAILELIVDG